MSTARGGMGVGAMGGEIYAVGGSSNNVKHPLSSAEAYTPGCNKWRTLAPMSIARSALGVGVIDGLMYAVGGFSSDGTALAIAEVYTPSSDSWRLIAPMSTARGGPGIGVLGGQLYVVGGGRQLETWTTVEVYTPSSDRWSAVKPMSTVREFLGVGVLGGLLYAVGGDGLASAEVYTPLYRCDAATGQCVASTDGDQTAAGCIATCTGPPAPPPVPPTPEGECHSCMAVPGQAWCWTANKCTPKPTPNHSVCGYTRQVCNNINFCKCTSCTDPVCGSPFVCANNVCVPSTSGLPREDCQTLCGAQKYKCVSNKCVLCDSGLPKATCEANCGPRALRGIGIFALE
jgi:hypothetical protein